MAEARALKRDTVTLQRKPSVKNEKQTGFRIHIIESRTLLDHQEILRAPWASVEVLGVQW